MKIKMLKIIDDINRPVQIKKWASIRMRFLKLAYILSLFSMLNLAFCIFLFIVGKYELSDNFTLLSLVLISVNALLIGSSIRKIPKKALTKRIWQNVNQIDKAILIFSLAFTFIVMIFPGLLASKDQHIYMSEHAPLYMLFSAISLIYSKA